jgi:phenylpropionate dioxygenase-like ring-hydroxylating dioxygenase large terminal subunit
MLRSKLSPSAYLSEDVLSVEQERIFRNLWIFAGVRSTLSSRNAFFTRNIGGVPLVVTTPDGETLKAYENLCSHRQMPIQHAAFGKRGLVCPYHAWSFTAEDGCLKGVGGPELYQMRASEKDQIRLREFAVRAVGNLVFVNLSPEPMPLEAQFTPEYLEQLREVSSHFDPLFAYTTFSAGYNWKFNFENVVDFNHVPYIHAESFGALMYKTEPDPNLIPFPEEVDWDRQELARNQVDLSDLSFPAVGDVMLPPRWYSNLVRRYGAREAYYNWFIYPNVNFGSVAGDYFLIQQYMPISPSRTEYHLWVVTAERLNRRQDFTALLRGLMDTEKKIIDEDSVLLEKMQASLYPSATPALHGAYENKLYRMGKWYSDNVLNPA